MFDELDRLGPSPRFCLLFRALAIRHSGAAPALALKLWGGAGPSRHPGGVSDISLDSAATGDDQRRWCDIGVADFYNIFLHRNARYNGRNPLFLRFFMFENCFFALGEQRCTCHVLRPTPVLVPFVFVSEQCESSCTAPLVRIQNDAGMPRLMTRYRCMTLKLFPCRFSIVFFFVIVLILFCQALEWCQDTDL